MAWNPRRTLPAVLGSWLLVFSSARAETLEYVYLTAGKREGAQTVEIAADGRMTVAYEYNDRGRGPKLAEEIVLGSGGVPVRYRASGRSYMGGDAAEQFDFVAGRASWRSPADSGEIAATVAPLYVPVEGSPAYLAVLVSAIAESGHGPLQAAPDGHLSVTRLQSVTVTSGAAQQDVTLFAINGIGFEPKLVWLDGKARLFAQCNGAYGSLLRAGWEASEPLLAKAQERASTELLANIAARVTRRPERPLAFHDVFVFDSVSGERSARPQTVYVFRNRITRIDPADAPPGADVEVIEGRGGTLLPGLVDMHTHLSGTGALLHLAAGVTTVRDLGNENASLLDLVSRIEAGSIVGPRVQMAGIIDGTSPFSAPGGAAVATLEEALRRVEWYAERGYWQVKLYSSVPPEWVMPIAKAAHERGLRVGGHVPAFMSAEQAIRAGYDEINHLNMLFLNFLAGPQDDTRTPLRFRLVGQKAASLDLDSAQVRDFVALLKERAVVIDPTVAIFENMFLSRPGQVAPTYAPVIDRLPVAEQRRLRAGRLGLSPEELPLYERSFAAMLSLIGKLYAAGVPLTPGTDDLEGFTLYRELELYVRAGIPPARVLQLATLEPMRRFGLEQSRGSVTPGKSADLVLVDGDPARDISTLRNVRYVMKDGALFDPAALYEAVGIKPSTPR